MFNSVDAVSSALSQQNYIADLGLSTSIFLGLKMGKALFLEGEPGVGKTEVAKVLSAILQTPLIRLQCYEGLDINHAVYEWNYPRQLLEIQAAQYQENSHNPVDDIFTAKFLLKRPLLQAIEAGQQRPPVL